MRLAARDLVYSTDSLNVTLLNLRGLHLTVNKAVRSVLCDLKRVSCAYANCRQTVAIHKLQDQGGRRLIQVL